MGGGGQSLEIEFVGVAFAVHFAHDVLVVIITAEYTKSITKRARLILSILGLLSAFLCQKVDRAREKNPMILIDQSAD